MPEEQSWGENKVNFTKGDLIAIRIVNNLATNPKNRVLEAKGNEESLALFSQFIAEAMQNTYLQNYTVTMTLKDNATSSFDLIDGEMTSRKSPPT